MTDPQKGVAAMVGACVLWGSSSLVFKQLSHVPALEVLAHRTIWGAVFFFLVLGWQRRSSAPVSLLRRHPVTVAAAALMISTNWLVFIWSVQVGHAMEASLGYYIFPLVAVLLGAVAFGERLSAMQWVAVGLAAAAVAGLTFGLGRLPLVALVLAVSFGLYGLLKKRIDAGAVVSVTAELVLLLPLVLGWLAWQHRTATALPYDLKTLLLLILTGPAFTAIPLMLFSYAARRARLATVGLVQYLNPTLQFLTAALVFHEPFTPWHAMTFGLIWLALAIYSGQAFWIDRMSRRRSISAGTSGTVCRNSSKVRSAKR